VPIVQDIPGHANPNAVNYIPKHIKRFLNMSRNYFQRRKDEGTKYILGVLPDCLSKYVTS
jgi:hypothetical protein